MLALSVVAGGVAVGAVVQPAIKTFTPHSAGQITNIDVLRQQIRNYYGDPLGTGVVGDTSYYSKEARGVAATASHWLSRTHPPAPR